MFYSFIIVLLLLVVAFGVYIVLYPNDFVEVKINDSQNKFMVFDFRQRANCDNKRRGYDYGRNNDNDGSYYCCYFRYNGLYGKHFTDRYEPEITEEVVKQGNIYFIGSFKEEKNANVFLQQKKETYSNVVSLGQGKTSNLWLVGLGPYEKMGEAQQFLKENNVNGWILKK